MNTCIERILAQDIVVDDEVARAKSKLLDHETLVKISNNGIKEFDILFTNDIDHGSYIADTLRADTAMSREEALIEIYKVMRPGEPPTLDTAEKLLNQCFNATPLWFIKCRSHEVQPSFGPGLWAHQWPWFAAWTQCIDQRGHYRRS